MCWGSQKNKEDMGMAISRYIVYIYDISNDNFLKDRSSKHQILN